MKKEYTTPTVEKIGIGAEEKMLCTSGSRDHHHDHHHRDWECEDEREHGWNCWEE